MKNSGEVEKSIEKTDAKKFYRVVWRWHFYAGLFVAPFMIILSVTGIIYLYKPQLDAVMYKDEMFVEIGQNTIAPDEQLKIVETKYPNAKVLKFRPNWESNRSSEFDVLTVDNRELKVFVNPYTNQVTGELDNKNNLQYYALEIHGKLMAGRFGEWIVELAVCWALVLLVSGVYLWFPRRSSFVWGVLIPRLRLKNSRTVWRDLHAVIGLYGVLIIAFMIFTGLPWTDFWGKNILRARESYPLANREKPKSIVPTSSLNASGEKTIPWAIEEMPLANSDISHLDHENHAQTVDSTKDNPSQTIAKSLNPTQILQIAKDNNAPEGFTVSLPQKPDGVFTISAFPDNPANQTTMHIDRYDGAILTDVRWKDYKMLPKTVEIGIALHEGKYFGWANQLLMLVGALTVLLLSVSGIVMWWKRRPAKRLGAPPMPENFPLWKTAVAIVFVMGVLFPLVGVSLIFVLLFDYLILQCKRT
ncbi:MAG: PepSY domain-containing protein [Pyrinomonadaceae bacterium]|nr:PepSY domain-containing protein [Pyrinomonadaceae bacterium]